MPYPCYFLQGSRYENLTTIRTSGDRFNPNHWNDFLYTSRLAASMGIWPWADVYMSSGNRQRAALHAFRRAGRHRRRHRALETGPIFSRPSAPMA